MFDVVKILTQRKETIATMESCSGGAIVNSITNIPGASEVLKFSAVTYANEFKIKMGVLKETIDKYSVYSMAVAKEMSKNISKITMAFTFFTNLMFWGIILCVEGVFYGSNNG